MNLNNRLLSKYFRKISCALPCSRKEKKKILTVIQENVADYLQTNPDATIANIEKHFGSPTAIASSYIDSADCENVIKMFHTKKTIKRAVIAVAAVIILLWGSVVAWAIVREKQHFSGWQVTDIVVESN